jgi:Porin subfamily
VIRIKGVLVGCVGGLIALAGAQAADLPVKATPVQYVKICSLYGVGFYYIPGTDMCIKVGGYMRGQAEWHSTDNGRIFGSTNGATGGTNNPYILGGLNNRLSNDLNFTGRGAISFDARSPTEFGTVRSYIRFLAQSPNGGVGAGPNVFTDRWFIQWAGLTVGLTQSSFDIFTTTERFSYFDAKTSGDTHNYGVEMFAYTFNFGNGVSATIAAETPVRHYQAGVGDGTSAVFALNGGTSLDTAGLTVPDFVGNLRIDQAWGYVGISGAIHRVAGQYYQTGNNEVNGHPSDKYGWAASAGGLVNLPWGDAIGANFAWTKGAVGYVTKAGSWQMYSDSSVGLGWVVDGIFDTTSAAVGGTDIQLTNAWSVNAAYEHVWNPQWRTSLYGGYTKVWYDDVATNIINLHLPGAAGTRPCGIPVAGAVWPPINVPVGSNNSCSPDFSFYQIGSRTQWNPAPSLAIGLDVTYTHLDTAYQGTSANLVGTNGSKPAVNVVDDQNIWSAIFRVQHNFYP